MMSLDRRYALIAWLLLSLAGCLWLGWRQFGALEQRFRQESFITLRLLSQKASQHDAVLATLTASEQSHLPTDMLKRLQTAMPQLSAIGYWRQQQWHGDPSGLRPPLALLWQAQQQRQTILGFDATQRYWLQSPDGWALLIDPQRMLAKAELPEPLENISLQLRGHRIELLQRKVGAAANDWDLSLERKLPSVSQPFRLSSRTALSWDSLPWLEILLWNALLAAIAVGLYAWHRQRASQQRQQQQDRLAAQARLNTLNEMMAGLAQELNPPLTAIIANTRQLERALDEPSQRGAVRDTLLATGAQARRAAALISRLSRLLAHPKATETTPLDPDALVNSLLFLRQAELADQNITLEWHNLSPEEWPRAERTALEQILHNLVQNACDALEEQGGRIVISGESDGHNYRFKVVDNGPGIDEAILPKIFLPFFTTRARGMGLGLPLCETLARAQGGMLHVQNAANGGVIAQLILPWAKRDA